MGGMGFSVNLPVSGSSTTSTSMQDTNATIGFSELLPSCDFFVVYGLSMGGNDASQIGESQCVTSGGTVLGVATAESNGAGSAIGGGRLQGFARYSHPDLTFETLKMQHRNTTSSDTNYYGGHGVMALRLSGPDVFDEFGDLIFARSELVENADYFYSGTNSSSAELSSIGLTWTTARTVDFNLVTGGDYFVFFSVETTLALASATDGHQARFQIDGTTQGAEWVKEWENNNDRVNFAYCDRVNLSAGSHTFRIQVQNRGTGLLLSAYRTRIWAFRADTWAVGAQDVETTGDSAVTHTAYSDSELFLSASYTPPTQMAYTGFATVNLGSSATGVNTLVEMRQQPASSGTGSCVDAGSGFNDAGLDSGDDLMPTVIFGSNFTNAGATGGFRVRTRISTSGTGTAGRDAANSAGVRNNLFIWPNLYREQDPLLTEGILNTER